MEDRELIRQQFKQYLNGACSGPEAESMLRFLYETPDEAFVESLIAENWDAPLHETLAGDLMIQRSLAQSRQFLRLHIQQEQDKQQQRTRTRRLFYAGIATAACIALAVFYLILIRTPVNIPMKEVTVPEGQIQKITLPDGSRLVLNAGTTIEYPTTFAEDKRIVTFKSGQAFFEVEHRNNQPFIVQGSKAQVTVLGTSFEIKSFKNDEQTRVAVATGKVGVQNNTDIPATMLTAGEQATINNRSNELVKSALPVTDIAGWRSNKLIFHEEPFMDIIHALERKYSVKVNVQKPSLSKEKITLSLDNESLDIALKALSLSNHFKYEIHENIVLVK